MADPVSNQPFPLSIQQVIASPPQQLQQLILPKPQQLHVHQPLLPQPQLLQSQDSIQMIYHDVPAAIQSLPQPQVQTLPQLPQGPNSVPLHLMYTAQPQQQQQTVTFPVQVAINPPTVINHNPQTVINPNPQTVIYPKPVEFSTTSTSSARATRPRKGKKHVAQHHRGGQHQRPLSKKRSKSKKTKNVEETGSEKPATKRRKKIKENEKVSSVGRFGMKQKGKFSRAVQTQQSKEELMFDLSLTVKEKIKEHVNTMEAVQMKEVLHRIAELQPGLVFDVIVSQLAARKKCTDKEISTPAQPVNYSEITMKRSGKGYIIEGHLYEGDRHDKEKGRIYLKCHKVKSGCKARARINGGEAVVLQRRHNHDLPNIIEMRFWNKAREEATKEEHRRKPLSKVYDIAKGAFLDEAKDGEERAAWEANIPSFKSVESGMRLKKAQVFTTPVNISMLDMTFNTLRDEILGAGNDNGGVQTGNYDGVVQTRARNYDGGVQTGIDSGGVQTDAAQHCVVDIGAQTNLANSTRENQGPSFAHSSQLNHIQINTLCQNDVIPPDGGYHGNMQIDHNVQGNMQSDQNIQGNMQMNNNDHNMQINSCDHGNMQISNNDHGNMQMSNGTQIGENSAAVETLLNL